MYQSQKFCFEYPVIARIQHGGEKTATLQLNDPQETIGYCSTVNVSMRRISDDIFRLD